MMDKEGYWIIWTVYFDLNRVGEMVGKSLEVSPLNRLQSMNW
jgi:hypothetical protein